MEYTEQIGNVTASGAVLVSDGESVLLNSRAGVVRALRAASCLLAPTPGDTVLWTRADEGEAWVLAVLRRAESEDPARLRLPEDSEIAAGRLRLRAERELDMRAERVALEGERVSVRGRLLALGGQALLQGFTVIQTAARWCVERVGKRRGRYGELSQRAAGLAELRAGRLRVKAETGCRLRAEYADIRAEKQLDLDAEHIKVG